VILADNFSILLSRIEVIVPRVLYGSDYIVTCKLPVSLHSARARPSLQVLATLKIRATLSRSKARLDR
ncbi:hypothetical protein K438DRAFT_1558508, partial [Mycena galopus ATCC 62051]